MAATKTPTLQDVVSDDLDYGIWAPIVKSRLVEKQVWDVVKYGIPPNLSKISELAAKIQPEDLSIWRDFVGKDTIALQILQSSLPDSVFRMTLKTTTSAKHLWDLLKEANEQCSNPSWPSEQGCSSMDSKRVKRSRHDRGDWIQCGGNKGHFFKDCNDSSYELPEYEMFAIDIAPVRFEKDKWMIYFTTTNHMTPYIKYFTNLDRTYRAKVRFIFGDPAMAEGIGDVVILTDEGKKKKIKNVLFVPGLNRNVLSVPQMAQEGYVIAMNAHKRTIKDQTGRLFGQFSSVDREFFLRLQVDEGNLSYDY